MFLKRPRSSPRSGNPASLSPHCPRLSHELMLHDQVIELRPFSQSASEPRRADEFRAVMGVENLPHALLHHDGCSRINNRLIHAIATPQAFDPPGLAGVARQSCAIRCGLPGSCPSPLAHGPGLHGKFRLGRFEASSSTKTIFADSSRADSP